MVPLSPIGSVKPTSDPATRTGGGFLHMEKNDACQMDRHMSPLLHILAPQHLLKKNETLFHGV